MKAIRWLITVSSFLMLVTIEGNAVPSEEVAQGCRALKRGQYSRAIECFSNGLAREKDDVVSLFNRGIAYGLRGKAKTNNSDLMKAIDDFDAVLQLDSKLTVAYFARGCVFYALNDCYGVIADFSQVLQESPDDIVALYGRAHCRAQNHDWDAAIADFTEAIRHGFELPKVYQERDRGLGVNRQSAAAIALVDPSFADAYYERGQAYAETLELEKALADFSETLRLSPNNLNAYENRALTYLHLGQHDSALSDYTAAIRLRPADPYPYYWRAAYLASGGDPDRHDQDDLGKALRDANKALALDPKFVPAYRIRSVVFQMQERFEKAIVEADKAVRLEPDTARSYRRRGIVLGASKQMDRAAQDFGEAIRRDPNSSENHTYRAFCLFWTQGEYERTFADFEEADQLDPASPALHLYRAWCLATCPDDSFRDVEQAVEDIGQALALNPSAPEALDVCSAVFAAMGLFDEAIQCEEPYIAFLERKRMLPTELKKAKSRLELYKAHQPYRYEPD